MLNSLIKSKGLYIFIGVMVVLAMSVWIININNEDVKQNDVTVNQQTETKNNTEASIDAASPSEEIGYFFVQEDNGIVNVYNYVNGEKKFYRDTSIPFELLSVEDQALLQTGVHLKNETELANFLENFES